MRHFAYRYICLALVIIATASARSTDGGSKTNSIDDQTGRSGTNGIFGDLRNVYQIYKECTGAEMSSCLKLRLLTAIDRVSRSTQLNIVDGITVVKDNTQGQDKQEEIQKTPQEIEESLPRALDDKEDALNNMIFDKVLKFFQSHTLQLKMPNVDEFSRSLTEEGKQTIYHQFFFFIFIINFVK